MEGVSLVWNSECGVGQVLGFTTEAVGIVLALEGKIPAVVLEVNNPSDCLKALKDAGFPSYVRRAMGRLMVAARKQVMTSVMPSENVKTRIR